MWDLLRDVLNVSQERPAGSVTADELAERAGLTPNRAACILRNDKRLRPTRYRNNGRQAVCYVPTGGGDVSR